MASTDSPALSRYANIAHHAAALMANLLLSIDPELDSDMRARIERALDQLAITYTDEDGADPDPEAPRPPRLVLAASHRARTSADPDTLVVLAGPAAPDLPPPAGAFRLEAADIEQRAPRWLRLLDRLGLKLGRPGLAALAAAGDDPTELQTWAIAYPTDPHAGALVHDLAPANLHARLAAEQRRADDAERRLAQLDRDHAQALRQTSDAARLTNKDSDRIRHLEAENKRLADLVDHAAYGLAHAPADLRPLLLDVRDHAFKARLAAARADAAAIDWPDALVWPKSQARYAGETRNGAPHGYGVMTFLDGATIIAAFRGQFADGIRSGHGVAIADGGCIWSGQWSDDGANGLGVLDVPDARRFEGEVAAGADGPREVRGFTWNDTPHAPPIHRPVRSLLDAPR